MLVTNLPTASTGFRRMRLIDTIEKDTVFLGLVFQ